DERHPPFDQTDQSLTRETTPLHPAVGTAFFFVLLHCIIYAQIYKSRTCVRFALARRRKQGTFTPVSFSIFFQIHAVHTCFEKCPSRFAGVCSIY
ncbi:MAG: hypothetical protein DMG40_02165, partial [Acidobacteria bacterium]